MLPATRNYSVSRLLPSAASEKRRSIGRVRPLETRRAICIMLGSYSRVLSGSTAARAEPFAALLVAPDYRYPPCARSCALRLSSRTVPAPRAACSRRRTWEAAPVAAVSTVADARATRRCMRSSVPLRLRWCPLRYINQALGAAVGQSQSPPHTVALLAPANPSLRIEVYAGNLRTPAPSVPVPSCLNDTPFRDWRAGPKVFHLCPLDLPSHSPQKAYQA